MGASCSTDTACGIDGEHLPAGSGDTVGIGLYASTSHCQQDLVQSTATRLGLAADYSSLANQRQLRRALLLLKPSDLRKRAIDDGVASDVLAEAVRNFHSDNSKLHADAAFYL